MIGQIISYINTRIESLNISGQSYGICDIITKGEQSYPAEFNNNEYKRVFDIDINDGIVYHRITGPISIEENEDESVSICDTYYTRLIPLKTVIAVRRSKFTNCNDAFLEHSISNQIANTISTINNKQLRIDTGFDSIVTEIKEITTNREEIFESEFSGIDNFFRYEYLYIAIDYNLLLTGSLSCFTNPCGESNDECTGSGYVEDDYVC